MRDVEPLVALQADQPRRRGLGKCLGRLGLADTRLTFEEQRLLEREREVQRGREAPLGQVFRTPEAGLQLIDRRKRHLCHDNRDETRWTPSVAPSARAVTESTGLAPSRRGAAS